MFSRIDPMLGHRRSLNKFKKVEIISIIFDHNIMKLEVNHEKNTEKHAKTWKLNDMLLNNEWVNSEVKEEIKRYLETMKMRTQHDDKGNNPMRGYNPSKHLCTQHRKHLNM